MLGTIALANEYEEFTIDFEVIKLGLWFDEENTDVDLSALEFHGENDGEVVTTKAYDFPHTNNPGWYNLTGRLLGFNSRLGYNEDSSILNIRGIIPKSDLELCEVAEFFPDPGPIGITMSLLLDPNLSSQQSTMKLDEVYSFQTPWGIACDFDLTVDPTHDALLWDEDDRELTLDVDA